MESLENVNTLFERKKRLKVYGLGSCYTICMSKDGYWVLFYVTKKLIYTLLRLCEALQLRVFIFSVSV